MNNPVLYLVQKRSTLLWTFVGALALIGIQWLISEGIKSYHVVATDVSCVIAGVEAVGNGKLQVYVDCDDGMKSSTYNLGFVAQYLDEQPPKLLCTLYDGVGSPVCRLAR